MNKDLRTGLILIGVVVAVLLLAYGAQAAGLGSSDNAPFGMQRGWMGGTRGAAGMAGRGHMMNFDQMPHWNQTGETPPFENCPYWQESQDE
jgi:hypothetical protein